MSGVLYVDTDLATTPNIYDNKTLHDLACWKPGRSPYGPKSWPAFVKVREYAEQLIKDGADVHREYGMHGETALIAATRRGYHFFMEFLLNHGASPYTRLANGNTALHFCAARLDIKGAEILRHHGEFRYTPNQWGHEPLGAVFLGPEESRLDMIRYLLDAGVSVNREVIGGDSPLHLAIGPTRMNKNTVTTDTSRAIVDLLVRYGADVSRVDSSFKSPLHIVAELRDRKMLYTLLSKAYKHKLGHRLGSPRMPPLDGVGEYTASEYTAYLESLDVWHARTSLLFIVLRCIEMMKRCFTFARGVHRVQTGMQTLSPEMISLITSYNITEITSQYTAPWSGRAIEKIAMVALGWMNDTPVKPLQYDWS